MRRIVFALPLLAATAVLAQTSTSSTDMRAAQTAQAEQGLAELEVKIADAACPVNMTARQQSAGETMWTISLEDAGARGAEMPKAGVHVDLKAWKGGAIRQVELAVNYLAPGWRVVPVGAAKSGDDLKKTYTLVAADGGSVKLAGDLLVGATAGVTRVTLLRVEYANGTSWHADSREACSVAPNGFKLVGAR